MKYSQTLIDDEYESSNIASQKEVEVSGNITLWSYTYLSTTNIHTVHAWTSISLTQKFKECNRNNR